MIDHTGLQVSDFARAKSFYGAALKPLGYKLMMEVPGKESGAIDYAGFGDAKPDFWLARGTPNTPRLHIAFAAASRAVVDAFYQAAIAAGGRDNGPPGLRPHYHADYYGAFVLDPDGHNIEAVCHAPPKAAARRASARKRKATSAKPRAKAKRRR
jgi:catechol 2,3-dioxygenase-like lactoylglutathione lyase family enzyme